jgi:Kef-type K+ transport system membrane component KefB
MLPPGPLRAAAFSMDSLLHPLFAFVAVGDNSAAHLPLALLLVFGTAKLLAEVFERIGQPGMIGEIIAGVLLGPSVLNWVQPDQVMTALAEMGAMFLLFRVGLEVKASDLFRLGSTALAVAILGVVFPFIAGWALFAQLGYSLPVSIFVGTAMVATSVGITARVLASKGLLELRASQVILAAAVIDDVLGLLVLAFVSSLGQGHVNVAGLAVTAVLASGFTVVIARFGATAFERVVPKVEAKLSVKEAQFNLALIVLFALSLLAVYIGVAAIIGAFLAGLAFSETATKRVQDLAHGITELLVPFFLAHIGLQLNLADFANKRVIWLSIVLLILAVITKLVGCGIGAIRLGRSDALRIGLGMMPRGEVGMIVAQIGLQMGIIEQSVYATIVFMAVGTTMLAPPLLNWAFRGAVGATPAEDFSLG